MENNHNLPAVLPATGNTTGAGNSNNEPITEEVVIYDECGDSLWDKVLAQTDNADSLEKKLQQALTDK